jgi:hypothetical protein
MYIQVKMADTLVPEFQSRRKNETESLRTEHLETVWLKKQVHAILRDIAYAGFTPKTVDESASWLVARLNTKPEKLLFVKS